MEFTGKYLGVTRDYDTGMWQISFSLDDGGVLNQINKIKGKKLRIKAVKHRNKRSNDANGYYWQLVEKIAEACNASKLYIHNRCLRRYGQLAIVDGRPIYWVMPDTEESTKEVDESEKWHLRPTTQVQLGNDGVMYRTYMMLVGSSEYDTREMSILIDGVVSEAKELGIETMPPDQLKELLSKWKA